MKRLVLLALALAVAAPATAQAVPAGEAPRKAPDITGTTLTGKKLSLKWYLGKPVFVNVWASW